MRFITLILSLIICFATHSLIAQIKSTARIEGKILETDGSPIEAATVSVFGTSIGTSTNRYGEYSLEVPAGKEITIIASFVGYGKEKATLKLNAGETKKLNFTLKQTSTSIGQVTIEDEMTRSRPLQRIDPKVITALPSATGGVEAILKTLPGVSSNNELTSQYSVRGGNFDENLVYVNDIEIFRPLLIRAGQQEGLSFVNSDMVSGILFSSGGFDAKYGDKMSSVLDIQYRKPMEFSSTASASLLGGSVHVEGLTKNYRLTYQLGVRHKANQYLLNSLETSGDYRPNFTDVQTFITYDVNEKWELNFLGNISRNTYRFIPKNRETEFGHVNEALRLTVYFDGEEKDKFNTMMGAVSAINKVKPGLTLKYIASAFQSNESEGFDIQGQYWLDELEKDISKDDFGEVKFNRGVGTFLQHARNQLQANVFSMEHKGYFNKENKFFQWGARYQHEIIDDKLSEWTMIDSADYSIPQNPSNMILLQNVVKAKIALQSNRYTAYAQNTWELGDSTRYNINVGFRANYWDLNNQFLVSPRATFSIIPNWERDVLFRFSTGYYYQPPFYRELRNFQGEVNPNLKAQRSIHFVLGSDYNFYAWGRPFKFITELYYKKLDKLVPYEYDNVRIRYYAENNAVGYVIGSDFKVNGEFVKGVESWFSLSIMQAKENLLNDSYTLYYNSDGDVIRPGYTSNNIVTDSATFFPGYIPRPTDQRVTAGIFFQDYIPKFPDFKMHLGLYFGTGYPFGPPTNDRFRDTLRMPFYRRVDIGFSYQVLGEEKAQKQKREYKHFNSLWVSAEVFNLLGVNNTVSYLWIKDIYNNQYAVPNYLTGRLINVKVIAKFK
jgi:hypothetical protein